MKRACVTGASGFIGNHLCRYLKERGYWVRAIDYVRPRYGRVECDERSWRVDLRDPRAVSAVFDGIDEVYALAADMGGAGFVFTGKHDFSILCNNALININTARACKNAGVKRVLFTSSACVYPAALQDGSPTRSKLMLRESDAWMGRPDHAYGSEKLFSEDVYTCLGRETNIKVRVARFHNVFGPKGSWNDGREKAPAALCRKAAEAKLSGNHEIEVWGDGEQVRSFCYIEDCLEMLCRLMQSNYSEPLNIGTDRSVSINDLIDIIEWAARIEVVRKHDLSKPQGVRSRNADLSKMREVLNYEPQFSLEDGIAKTYVWIEQQVKAAT